jgi:hypothetical protein
MRRLDPVAVMSGSAGRSGRFPTRDGGGVFEPRGGHDRMERSDHGEGYDLVGLDVHAAKIAAAVFDVENGEMRSYRPPGDVLECGAFCSGLARPARATYEANRRAMGWRASLSVACAMPCARAGEHPAAAGDSVKTDRSAERLARLLLARKLHA